MNETTYCLEYRVHATGACRISSFDSMTARALFVIALSAWADVLREWIGTRETETARA